MTRTRATKSSSQGIVLWRNIQERAASEELPRLARSKRAQQMELVTRTAVTQNASQARCMVDMPWLGVYARIASSTALTKALTKGAGFPNTIAVPIASRIRDNTIGTVATVGTGRQQRGHVQFFKPSLAPSQFELAPDVNR